MTPRWGRSSGMPTRHSGSSSPTWTSSSTSERASEGEPNLHWEWSDDVAWEPKVQMTMNSETANRYFQGKENVAIAIAQAPDQGRRRRQGGARADPDHQAAVRALSRDDGDRLPPPRALTAERAVFATGRLTERPMPSRPRPSSKATGRIVGAPTRATARRRRKRDERLRPTQRAVSPAGGGASSSPRPRRRLITAHR